jgi:hypothetical protein
MTTSKYIMHAKQNSEKWGEQGRPVRDLETQRTAG